MARGALRLITAGLVLGLAVGTSAAACDDLVRGGGRLVQTGSDDALRPAITLGDEALRLAPVTVGSRVSTRIRTLSDDPTVQDAAYGLAWDVLCDVVTRSLPATAADLRGYVISAAASFALEFTDEGAQELGEAILEELDQNQSEIREVCADLQPD